jgi:hypothetical protein
MDAASLNLTTKVLGFGRFLFVDIDPATLDSAAPRNIDRAVSELENAHFTSGHPTPEAMQRGRYQLLRQERARFRSGDVEDREVQASSIAIRLEGDREDPLAAVEERVRGIVEASGGTVHLRGGVRKDRSYTSHAMNQFAYAHALAPAAGEQHALGVYLPQRKTSAWWAMHWMRRESFFLPRYGDDGAIVAEGHANATADGIPHLVRRLYHHAQGYGLDHGYDFTGYFEFAEAHAGVFDAVMKRLRDPVQNPEWNYVREGPEWWGRRVASAEELMA